VLFPDSPETQLGMNEQAQDNFQTQDLALEHLIRVIKEEAEKDIHKQMQFDEKLFDKCMNQWNSYRQLHAEYVSNRYAGGSMQPLIYLSDMEKITKEKIESLSAEFEFLLRKINFS